MYFQNWSAYSAAGKYVDWSWEYLNRSQTPECWIRTEAAQFPEKDYKNVIFLAVQVPFIGKQFICFSPKYALLNGTEIPTILRS